MTKRINPLLKGASFLGVSTFISKLIGAIYRVPLTNLIGATGLGLYQMVFPVYSLLLDFSGAGVPSAISKLISEDKTQSKFFTAESYLKSSLRLFVIFGTVFFLFMLIFSKIIATVQGNSQAYLGYIFLSPSVLLCSIISCFRGYFQGLMNMKKTALSNIIEQIVKLIMGLFFVWLFLPDKALATGGATLGITISELIALIYLVISYKRYKKKNNIRGEFNKTLIKSQWKTIIKTTFPITLTGIMIPLSQVIDSFLIVNILSTYTNSATALYGILSGVVMTIINLPVSICYGVAQVAIPMVAGAKDEKESENNINTSLIVTGIISFLMMILIGIFAPMIIKILFSGLKEENRIISINLLKIMSPCVVLLSVIQTLNGIMIGKGKLYYPVISLLAGVIIKTILNIFLLKIPSLNIYGGGIANIACYFIVCLINLLLIKNLLVKYENKTNYHREYAG